MELFATPRDIARKGRAGALNLAEAPSAHISTIQIPAKIMTATLARWEDAQARTEAEPAFATRQNQMLLALRRDSAKQEEGNASPQALRIMSAPITMILLRAT